MLKRPAVAACIFVLLLALVFLNLPSRVSARLKMAVSGVFLPLIGLSHQGDRALHKVADTVVPRKTLVEQVESLSRENQRLQLLARQSDETLLENARLRAMLGAPKPAAWKCRMARVIGRDPSNWWRTLYIDLGSKDGLVPNLTVFSPEGLVGRTAEVSPTRSQVILVGDPACRVSAMIMETRDNTGVIVPNTANPSDVATVNLTFLSRNSVLKPGQTILTSGQGGVFPKGIVIGKVLDSALVEYGLYAEARVQLAVNFNALEEVWVLLP